MTNFKLTPQTTGYELHIYARYVLKGPLPDGPLLEAFRERADEDDLGWYTEDFGPLPPKDPWVQETL